MESVLNDINEILEIAENVKKIIDDEHFLSFTVYEHSDNYIIEVVNIKTLERHIEAVSIKNFRGYTKTKDVLKKAIYINCTLLLVWKG